MTVKLLKTGIVTYGKYFKDMTAEEKTEAKLSEIDGQPVKIGE